VAKVKYRTPVPLDGIDPRLDGVVALADVQVLLGESGGRPAVLGALPKPDTHAEAVREFAASLAATGQIDFGGPVAGGRGRHGAVAAIDRETPDTTTHRVVATRRVRVLERVRFTCHCA
jgi:hypothetical protein